MQKLIEEIINQDIGFEDLTTNALIPPDLQIKAQIISKDRGILAGIEVGKAVFDEFSIRYSNSKNDGDTLQENDLIMEVEGDARSILSVERTVLNLLMRMSGIATLTNHMLMKIRKSRPNIILAGTRKTTPGLQFLEKQAIRMGGGDPHRYRLDDSVLIKDNHLVLVGDVKKAIDLARSYASFTTKIEVEADTKEQALEAAYAGADIIMLDNMDPNMVKDVISSLNVSLPNHKVLIEVSGGITQNNIVDYAIPGVDVISSGYITHSAISLDIGLEINKL